MEKKLLDALFEVQDARYNTLEEAMKDWSEFEILDAYLRWEGILGYTSSILNAISFLRNE